MLIRSSFGLPYSRRRFQAQTCGLSLHHFFDQTCSYCMHLTPIRYLYTLLTALQDLVHIPVDPAEIPLQAIHEGILFIAHSHIAAVLLLDLLRRPVGQSFRPVSVDQTECDIQREISEPSDLLFSPSPLRVVGSCLEKRLTPMRPATTERGR